MSDTSAGPSALPADQLQPTEVPTSTFSKIVATCLHDLQDFSDVWYPLAESESEDTPNTLAGRCLKTLLNNAMKDEKIMDQVWEIVAQNEPMPSSKSPYLPNHPEFFEDIWKIQIPLPIRGILGIEIGKTEGRLVVKGRVLTRFPIGEDFQWSLFYAHCVTTELALDDFRVSVVESDRPTREDVLNKFMDMFHEKSKSSNGNCDVRCYRETPFHFNDHKGNIIYFKLSRCYYGDHNRFPKRGDPEFGRQDYNLARRVRRRRLRKNSPDERRMVPRQRIRRLHDEQLGMVEFLDDPNMEVREDLRLYHDAEEGAAEGARIHAEWQAFLNGEAPIHQNFMFRRQ